MVNKLFKNQTKKNVPVATTKNAAGGNAYDHSAKHALSQIACTNVFNNTYYVGGEQNLKIAREAAQKLVNDPEFLAKVAVYCRDRAYMKDMPAFLTCVLADIDTQLFRKVFRRVVDNGKMLRNVIQIARSGQAGKVRNMSAGTYRHAIHEWFRNNSAERIFNASVGNDPSMRDIILMSHVKPETKTKAALYAYLLGGEIVDNKLIFKDKKHAYSNLPAIIRQYEEFKQNKTGDVPKVDFRLLDSLGLTDNHWKEIARNAPWTMTRMNLNTFVRHNVFSDQKIVKLVADRLRNPENITKARAYPYQILTAFENIDDGVPKAIVDALQDAMEFSISNVPKIEGETYICVDCSGSMHGPITGYRSGSTSKTTCVTVAALIASAILRQNSNANIILFGTGIDTGIKINSRDTVLTNAKKIGSINMGGTNCSLPMKWIADNKKPVDNVIYVSDCESWLDAGYNGTGMQTEWTRLKSKNKKAKLVCIDLTPSSYTQLKEHKDVLQVGGFGDQVFDVMSEFFNGDLFSDKWISLIEQIEI